MKEAVRLLMNEKINRRRIVHCVVLDMAKLWGGIATNLSSHLSPVNCGPKPSNAPWAGYQMA